MKSWIFSIGVIILVTTVISLILPDGSLKTHVKNTFSFIIILIIVSPIVTTKNSKIEFNDLIIQNDIVVQENYIEYIKNIEKNIKANHVNYIIENLGIIGADVELCYLVENNDEKLVSSVKIDLSNAVINSNLEHIDIISKLKTSVADYLSIHADAVLINE